jgi:hypothetical protein
VVHQGAPLLGGPGRALRIAPAARDVELLLELGQTGAICGLRLRVQDRLPGRRPVEVLLGRHGARGPARLGLGAALAGDEVERVHLPVGRGEQVRQVPKARAVPDPDG